MAVLSLTWPLAYYVPEDRYVTVDYLLRKRRAGDLRAGDCFDNREAFYNANAQTSLTYARARPHQATNSKWNNTTARIVGARIDRLVVEAGTCGMTQPSYFLR